MEKRPILTAKQANILIKRGELPQTLEGGIFQCSECYYVAHYRTDTPDFHQKGDYHYCMKCGKMNHPVVIFPQCKNFPKGFEIKLGD